MAKISEAQLAQIRRAYDKAQGRLIREDLCDICAYINDLPEPDTDEHDSPILWTEVINCLQGEYGFMCSAHQRSLGLKW